MIRSVLVAHRSAMVAEGVSAALTRFPGVVVGRPATSTREVEESNARLDAVALDGSLPGVDGAAARLRRKGVRVVVLEEEEARPRPHDEDGVRVSIGSPVAVLAAALVPGLQSTRPRLPLTARERQVLTLASEGLCAKQIANHLGLSTKTVEHHKSRVFVKLGVPNQAAAVRLLMSSIEPRISAWNPSSI